MEKKAFDPATAPNAANLHFAITYLQEVFKARLDIQFGEAEKSRAVIELPSLGFFDDGSAFSRFIAEHQPPFEEYVVLLLALTPHVMPGFIGNLVAGHLPNGGELPDFGGVKANNHRGIIPTGETAQFILAGADLEKRLEVQQIFGTGHWFHQKNILHLEAVPPGEPLMSGRIVLDPEVVELLTQGRVSKPRFSTDFPAEYIQTEMDWDDLVLAPATLRQIREIESWVRHQQTFFETWGMGRRVKPGYRVLFHGPPGTGKTLTATLLGKYTGRDVFKIDLSMVVSKYIGETEKNLARLFDKAQNKNWILFFDEADALFGKRTSVRDAHDKYANQEVSYLLQRIESYPGLTILASNFKSNIDDAFLRRFQAMIFFPIPKPEERQLLWEKAFPPNVEIDPKIDWPQVSQHYELTGASIMNVVQYCCITALEEGTDCISHKNLHSGIRNELVKEGKMV
ncbi:MAG: ATP-binding protein [Bacteroidetes bacterium]|nr:ATP-binding protein [Bacteroidota bacterium]